MKCCVLGVIFAVTLANAFEPEVRFEESNGLRILLKDEPFLNGVKFEAQLEDQPIQKQLIEHAADGVWQIDPPLKVKSGDKVRYKVTAYYDNDVKETEWLTHELSSLRLVRSMKRAIVFRDDYTSCNIASIKQYYTIDCTAWGGGNGEFQVYVPESRNLYCSNGNLNLKPTLTVDHPDFGENRLSHGRMNLNEMYGYCTMADNWGCDRTAVNGNVLNPIMSGKVTTKAAIKYGRVNVRAFIPKGDWLWPAIWMLPRDWVYGGWPRSGEIDIMESRGNQRAEAGGNDHGIGEVSSTLHWGPAWNNNAYAKTHGEKDKSTGDWHGWHIYSLEWDEHHIKTMVDGEQIMNIPTPNGGFWHFGGFGGTNIWAHGGQNAPFDQYFQLILNVAVGGGFFPSSFNYDHSRPWNDGSPKQEREFWDRRSEWLATWHGDNVALKIDYIEMIQQ